MLNENILRCPCSRKCILKKVDGGFICGLADCVHHEVKNSFCLIGGVPILISRETCDTLCNPDSVRSYIKRLSANRSWIKNILVGDSQITIKNARLFLSELLSRSACPALLIVGAGERGSSTNIFFDNRKICVTGTDIYKSEDTDLICDAHYMPFEDESFDGVWIQAVLEHVVDPVVVVREIHRILKPNGVVYAETPFMQQVHEGAYDFTRFTVLGHRYLFRDFSAIDFGGNGGADISLAWSIRYFIWGITRSKWLARFSWFGISVILRPFRIFISQHSLYDASSGVYFLGNKSALRIKHSDLPELYKGMN